MTEPNTEPAAVNGQDPNGTPAPAQPSFEERMRNDPAFALEQYNKMKSENTKLFQKTKALEPLEKIAAQVQGGAAEVAKWIYEYDGIVKHGDVARIVDHYRRTGTLPATAATQRTDDTFDTEFPDPQAQELNALKAQVQTLQSQISQTRGAVGKTAVVGMLSQLKTEYPDGFDEYVMPALQTKFQEWEATPQGRELLATLNYENLKTVAARSLMDHLDEIGEKRHARKLGELKRTSTGDVRTTISNGREPPADRKHVSALEALREFESREGPLTRRI